MNIATELSPGAIPRADFGRVTVYFGDKNGKYPDGNQVIVRGSDTQAAFDTPVVANRIGSEFDASDIVILSHVHEDHMAGLKRLPKAAVHVHEADLAAVRSVEGLVAAYGSDPSYVDAMLEKFRKTFSYAPRPDAIGYADGAVWDLGKSHVRAFHTPGHTAGHCALLVEPEGVAFIGDIDLTGFGPYYGDASSSLTDFRTTLAKVANIPAKIWVTFHHRGVYTDREKFVSDLATYTRVLDARDQRLLDLLRASPKTLAQLVECRLLYPPGYQDFWVVDAETRSISMHLSEMLADGRVLKDENGVYRPG